MAASFCQPDPRPRPTKSSLFTLQVDAVPECPRGSSPEYALLTHLPASRLSTPHIPSISAFTRGCCTAAVYPGSSPFLLKYSVALSCVSWSQQANLARNTLLKQKTRVQRDLFFPLLPLIIRSLRAPSHRFCTRKKSKDEAISSKAEFPTTCAK